MTSKATAPASPWLFGPVRDLLFGCGLVYLVAFAALASAGDAIRASFPLGLAFIATTLVSGPHYGATLLRVYERAEDRRRYRLFAVWATAALAALFVWGLYDVDAGSWLVTVYLTWSPWHYAGQNFGVALMFPRRRGVEVTPAARQLLWWSFSLSFALTFLAVHGASPAASYAPDDLSGTALGFRPLGISESVQRPLIVAVGAAYVAATAGALALLKRGARWADLVPTAAIILSQALWFTVPTLARHWRLLPGVEPLSAQHAHYAFLWIGLAHAAQYLWITSYYAARAGDTRRHATFLAKSLFAGAAIWTIPALVFAPRALGRLPYDAGLALLVAAFVNLHHFVLDGAIWKLREGRIAKILLGGGAGEPVRPSTGTARRLVLAAGAVCLAIALYGAVELEFGFNRAVARGDLARASSAVERLAWLGRDGAEMHSQIADRAADAGDVESARHHFREALALRPDAWTWVALGRTYARDSRWRDAGEAFDAALRLDPGHAVALFYRGVVDLETGHAAEGRERLLRARDSARDPRVLAEIDEVIRRYGVTDAPR